MIPAEQLWKIRNDLPIAVTVGALASEGPPSKIRGGRFDFLCPHCAEMLVYINPKNNLAHCFACRENLNKIDLLRVFGHDFHAAVTLLERWLKQHQRNRSPI